MSLPPLFLASASPRRAQLLRQMGIEFVVVAANAVEAEDDFLTPSELTQLNAYRKARAVAKHHPDALVLGADTTVCLGARTFGKPVNLADARRMLRELQGRTHEVVTGVCLLHLRAHRQRLLAETTSVTFRPLDDAAIDAYLSRIQPLDKAGGYAIQEHGDLLVQSVSGSFDNVVGLPTERLRAELGRWQAGPSLDRITAAYLSQLGDRPAGS